MADDDSNDVSEFQAEGVVPGSDGSVYGVRVQDGVEQPGVLVRAPEGSPVAPGVELVHSEHLDGNTFRLTTLYKPKGPSRVATRRYRTNYDAVFGKSKDTDWN